MDEAWVGGPMRGLRPRHESITELSWQEIGLGSEPLRAALGGAISMGALSTQA